MGINNVDKHNTFSVIKILNAKCSVKQKCL